MLEPDGRFWDNRGLCRAAYNDAMTAPITESGYSAEISRANPTCFLFLVDQSASMNESAGGEGVARKADLLADALNRVLHELVIKCGKDDGVRDFFHVGAIGYGARIGSAWAGSIAGRDLVPISELSAAPARTEQRRKKVPDGAGGLVEQLVSFPVWIDPVADGPTPMCSALGHAGMLLDGFLEQYRSCFPPVVLNITDGEPTDGDPLPLAEALTRRHSTDGNVLLFNLHITADPAPPISFPSTAALLGDAANRLFAMSSKLPVRLHPAAREYGFAVTDSTRGFVYNADVVKVVQFLDIGTRVYNQELR
jgi:hypothetical protein